MKDDEKILRAMRTMAWERAKGEIEAMLHTYYETHTTDYYDQFCRAYRKFVKQVEDNGWQE